MGSWNPPRHHIKITSSHHLYRVKAFYDLPLISYIKKHHPDSDTNKRRCKIPNNLNKAVQARITQEVKEIYWSKIYEKRKETDSI